MCGLFGATSGYLSENDLIRVRDLGIISQFRGTDSTGIAIATHIGKRRKSRIDYSLLKKDVDPSGFFLTPSAEGFLVKSKAAAVIGHCRAATKGVINEANAHPFEFSNLIGAHNGTIHSLVPKDEGATDSEELYRRINEVGLQKALDDLPYDGAYALTYFDKQANTLNLLRNSDRTLFLLTHGATTYWASEAVFLYFLANRCGFAKDSFTIEAVEQDTLYTCDIGSNKFTHTKNVKRTHKIYTQAASMYTDRSRFNKDYIPERTRPVDDLFKNTEAEKPVLALPKPSDTTPSTLSYNIKAPDGMSVTPTTIESARRIYPLLKREYPANITIKSTKDGAPIAKMLKYRNFFGEFVDPDKMRPLLSLGCSLSKRICDIYETTYWMSPEEYVCGDVRNNELISAIMKHEGRSLEQCLLYYISPIQLNEMNKRAQKNKDNFFQQVAKHKSN